METGPDVVVDTIGDTIVVRTLAGSVWGGEATLEPELSIGELDGPQEYLFGRIASLAIGDSGTIYVLDSQVPEIRVFDRGGVYLRTLGRSGEGPGELSSPMAIAVLSDGRVLARDSGNQRVQVYTPEGEADAEWSVLTSGSATTQPLWVDHEDRAYVVTRAMNSDMSEMRSMVIVVASDGTPIDTLAPPGQHFEVPQLEVVQVTENSRGRYLFAIPFGPRKSWAFHPNGHAVLGINTAYRIDMLRTEQPTLRIERVHEPIRVTNGERDEEESTILRSARSLVPDWRWSGPRIPVDKPPFRALYIGRDGRIWVLLHMPGIERDDPNYDPTNPDAIENRWHEPLGFDVFEQDGTYLGSVVPPDEFRISPTPVFDGDFAWSVTRDELGVERVVRYRLVVPPPTA